MGLDSVYMNYHLYNHIDIRLKPWTAEYSPFKEISDHITTHLEEKQKITLYAHGGIKRMFGSLSQVSLSVYQPIREAVSHVQ